MKRWTLFLLLLLTAESLTAQRGTSYPELANQQQAPGIQQQTNLLPLPSGQSLIIYSFRAPQTRIPFRRVTNQTDGERFEAEIRMDLELRSGDNPVARKSWVDTVRVATYEETQDPEAFVEGALSFPVSPGEHRLFHASSTLRPTPPPAGRGNDRRAANRPITIDVPEELTDPRMILLASHEATSTGQRMTLMNMGPDARYGEPYQLLLLLPKGEPDGWTLRILPAQGREDRPALFETDLNPTDRLHPTAFELLTQNGSPVVAMSTGEQSEATAAAWIVPIPNENWPSRPHRIELRREGEEEPVATQTVTPRWPDMPVSLLNLDLSIDMLRFILPDDQLRELKRGSAAEKERKWMAFWSERDPTPETEYNELMVEYYRRIDHAWDEFTTPEQPGYNSDQGQTWIRLGPPQRTERSYPPDGNTLERWYYPDRTITFEATTGFGDFRRIGVEER